MGDAVCVLVVTMATLTYGVQARQQVKSPLIWVTVVWDVTVGMCGCSCTWIQYVTFVNTVFSYHHDNLVCHVLFCFVIFIF